VEVVARPRFDRFDPDDGVRRPDFGNSLRRAERQLPTLGDCLLGRELPRAMKPDAVRDT
jgi:hypothetical protein